MTKEYRGNVLQPNSISNYTLVVASPRPYFPGEPLHPTLHEYRQMPFPISSNTLLKRSSIVNHQGQKNPSMVLLECVVQLMLDSSPQYSGIVSLGSSGVWLSWSLKAFSAPLLKKNLHSSLTLSSWKRQFSHDTVHWASFRRIRHNPWVPPPSFVATSASSISDKGAVYV